jgi:hypothetical protein
VSSRRLVLIVPALVLALAVWFGLSTHRAPTGQPPLAVMDLEQLRADFNRSADSTRVIVLLSPT